MGVNIGFLNRTARLMKANRLGDVLLSLNLITQSELDMALSYQKVAHKPLGHVLVQNRLISGRALALALTCQSSLRLMGGTAAVAAALFAFGMRPSQAGNMPAEVTLASTAYSGLSAAQPLFETGEKRSGDLSSFTKWNAMFGRFDRDLSAKSNDAKVKQWMAALEDMRGQPLETVVTKVNSYMNRVPYISDNKNWGRSDYWGTPVEFLERGGDCEDFAIAKYVSLRALGVPDSRLRIAVVKDTQKNIPHAILIVYTDNGPMVLDNQIKTVKSASSIHHYKPIFSINKQAWWLHTKEKPSYTVVASSR